MSRNDADAEAANLAALAKAIGHPARVLILRFLSSRNECVAQEVVDQLPLAQSTVSEHLRILRDAGLINARPQGSSTLYCVNQSGLGDLKQSVAAL